MEQDRVLGTAAPVRHLSWAAGQLEAAVLAQLAAQLGDPNSRRPPATLIHTWRPLILCSRGDQPSTQAVLTILTTALLYNSNSLLSAGWTLYSPAGVLPEHPAVRLPAVQVGHQSE